MQRALDTDDCRRHWRRLVAARTYAFSVQFTAAITHEGDWFVARCLEVEVTSQGESVDGALENLKEALALYFEDQVGPASFENPVLTTFQLSA
jgi:predicted RNase H-like HicB family nuclease